MIFRTMPEFRFQTVTSLSDSNSNSIQQCIHLHVCMCTAPLPPPTRHNSVSRAKVNTGLFPVGFQVHCRLAWRIFAKIPEEGGGGRVAYLHTASLLLRPALPMPTSSGLKGCRQLTSEFSTCILRFIINKLLSAQLDGSRGLQSQSVFPNVKISKEAHALLLSFFLTAKALYRKFETNIPRNETAQGLFPNSYIHVSAAKQADRSWESEYINRSQIHECGNWKRAL